MANRSSFAQLESDGGGGELAAVLRDVDLGAFEDRLRSELQLSRLEHFDHIGDEELEALAGLSLPAIRRLRAAIDKRRRPKFRSLFGSLGGSVRAAKPRPPTDDAAAAAAAAAVTCLISKDQLKLMERIGEGSFAVVKRAIWNRGGGKKLDVAVKILREGSSLGEEMEVEVENMHRLQHPNLIRLFGLVFASPVMMVVELCEGGALLDRLRRPDQPRLLALQLLDFAVQISRGMCYLEQMRFIHRDLATRNVLLTKNEKTVKIGDFGLMRALPDKDEHYVMQGQKKVPFAWCPPESLKRRQFSHASDVWSLGVTFWEMFSFGEEPWCGFRGPEILKRVEGGERLAKPTFCPASLYSLFLSCWALAPEQRPRFPRIKDRLKEIREQEMGVGECLEAQPGDAERGLLRLELGEALIVVEGLPEQPFWLGQSMKTRAFGRFPRKAFHFSDRRSKTRDISRPIKSSFIHAGHGDAAGGESWGQPDKIDPLILQNPMPLIDLGGPVEPTPHLGAVVVESAKGLGPSRLPQLQPPPPNGRRESRQAQSVPNSSRGPTSPDEADPFAPFDDYGSIYDATPTPTQPPSREGNYYAMPPSAYYGAVDNGINNGAKPSTSDVPEDPGSAAPPRVTPVPPRPQRVAAALPPPVSIPMPVVVPPPPPIVQRPSPPRPSPAAVPRPAAPTQPTLPPPVDAARLGTEWLQRNLASVITPQPPISLSGSVPDLSGPDPFEVPETARSLVRQQRYSQVYKGEGSNGMLRPTPSPVHMRQAHSQVHARPASATLGLGESQPAHRLSGQATSGAALTVSTDRHSVASSAMVEELMARLTSMDAAIESLSAEPPPPVQLHSPGSLGRQPPPSYSAAPLQPMGHRATSLGSLLPDPSLLDQFDPLSGGGGGKAEKVAAVLARAPFGSAPRVAVLLGRCGMDVGRTIQELKVEKLVDMGLAGGPDGARAALLKADWDVNAAAAQLLG